jgi:hypothetical protein
VQGWTAHSTPAIATFSAAASASHPVGVTLLPRRLAISARAAVRV